MLFVLPVHLFSRLITSLMNDGVVLFVLPVHLFSRLITSFHNKRAVPFVILCICLED